jgi:hypothetical protein
MTYRHRKGEFEMIIRDAAVIFVIDMLNHVQVYVGMSTREALIATKDYMSFMGISDESIQEEVVYK